MSKRSKRRKNQHKHQSKKQQQTEITSSNDQAESIEDLIEKGEFAHASELLQEQLGASATDKTRRLLIKCYVNLKQYQKAVICFAEIQDTQSFDWFVAGLCFIQLEKWDIAIAYFNNSLEMAETSRAFYWLAVAHQRGRNKYSLDDEEKALINQYLQKAISLPDCPVEVFLWLEDNQPWGGEDVITMRVKILNQALLVHPNSSQVRYRLAQYLINRQANPKQGLNVLTPVLESEFVSPDDHYLAFQAYTSLGEHLAALQQLNAIKINDDLGTSGLYKLKGDTLSLLHQVDEAEALYVQELQASHIRFESLRNKLDAENEQEDHRQISSVSYDGLISELGLQIIVLFDLARVYLDQKNVSLALDKFLQGTELLLSNHLSGIRYDEEPPSLVINYTGIGWIDVHTAVETTCKRIFRVVQDHIFPLDHRLLALVSYTLCYLYDEDHPEGDLQQRDYLLLQAAELEHPNVSYLLIDYYFKRGDFPQVVDHHLRYWLWRASLESSGDFWGIHLYDEDEKKIGKTIGRKTHRVAYKYLEEYQSKPETIKQVFFPFYESFWRRLFFEAELYAEAISTLSILISVDETDTSKLFDYAYCLDAAGHIEDARTAYESLLKLEPDNPNALHNLSIIWTQKGDYEQAQALSQKAANLAPNDELIVNRAKQLRHKIHELRQEREQQRDFLRTAPERWPTLDRYKRQLLSTLTAIQSFNSWQHLETLTGIDQKYLKGHWRKLVELGMIIGNKNGSGSWQVNEHIYELIDQERSHALITKVIRTDSTINFKPVFNSKLEYTIYNILIGLFPNHLVFPNMALQSIFQYDRLKELLDPEDFRYYLMATVDFCITSTANYLPIITFEVDSQYHDLTDQQIRDERKNYIFQVGGVPLLRLRAMGRPTEQTMRRQIIEVVKALGEQLSTTDSKVRAMINLGAEINFEQFRFLADDFTSGE